jgi:hypothetical protein
VSLSSLLTLYCNLNKGLISLNSPFCSLGIVDHEGCLACWTGSLPRSFRLARPLALRFCSAAAGSVPAAVGSVSAAAGFVSVAPVPSRLR